MDAVTMGESALVSHVSVDSFVTSQYLGNSDELRAVDFKVPHNEMLGMVTKNYKAKEVSNETLQQFMEAVVKRTKAIGD